MQVQLQLTTNWQPFFVTQLVHRHGPHMQFAGDFESHITVSLGVPEGLAELQMLSRTWGLKCLHILLERGRTPSQPMLSRRSCGTLTSELSHGRDLCQRLRTNGFVVTRLKLEVSPYNVDVPSGTCGLGPAYYFEHHIKLLLPVDADAGSLIEIAERHTAHLSRNALKRRDDGWEERFVTQRVADAGRIVASQRLRDLLRDLERLSIPRLDVEEEFVVFDNQIELDAGWIHPEE